MSGKEQTTKLCAGCKSVRFVVDVGDNSDVYCEHCLIAMRKAIERPKEESE